MRGGFFRRTRLLPAAAESRALLFFRFRRFIAGIITERGIAAPGQLATLFPDESRRA